MPYSLLLIEDDALIGQGLELGLGARGYHVVWLQQGIPAIAQLQHQHFDVLILDLGLPDIDGIDLLCRIRNKPIDTPVIVLTARDSQQSLITGLDQGADEYLIKPVSTDEIAARIRSLLRRIAGHSSSTLTHQGLTMDTLSRKVNFNNEPIALTPIEFSLIEILLTHAGKAVSADRLIAILEQSSTETTLQSIHVHVHSLRKKFGHDMIKTIRGSGYLIG
ncbi:MAG: response regulator transcription factor [Granulosicoccus sp.]